MLFGLERLQGRIVGAAIPEAEVYRDERLYKRPRQARIARGQTRGKVSQSMGSPGASVTSGKGGDI